jgi:phosphoenolpyruvate-protein kinase (PTS system EI component)
VLRLVPEVTTAATVRARVAVCGELASDPAAAALLVGLGVQELSVSPPAIPAVKNAVRSVSASKARRTAASVRALLSDLS